MHKKPEILAPAGNPDKLESAIRYGADAVYLAGRRFGLRAASANFLSAELAQALALAHAAAVKVYVAVNAVAREDELPELAAYARELESLGADAAIVSDPGVFRIFRENAPSLPLHISTQANVSNSAACRFWYEQGARRIVLARELSLAQIRAIRRSLPPELELECFVHGAMCLAHSGRCLLSAYFNERSANRGACTQPCRWSYSLREAGRPAESALPLEEDEQGSYLLSANDLCMIEHIPALCEAGISSFKIEGRMKGRYYAALTTKVYREARDAYWADPKQYRFNPEWLEELEWLVHRPYSTGFYFDDPRCEADLARSARLLKQADVVALVLPETEARFPNYLRMRQMNKISVGDCLSVLSPASTSASTSTSAAPPLRVEALLDETGQPITDTAHPGMCFYLRCEQKLLAGSFLRRRGDKDSPQ